MTKAPSSLQELRRRIYRKAKSDVSAGGDGVTNTTTTSWGCIGTGKSSRCPALGRCSESGRLKTGLITLWMKLAG